MATSNWEKFVLLLWKNWILQKRHYIQTLFEVLIPVLCCSILLLVRGLVDPEYIDKNTVFRPLETDRLPSFENVSKEPIYTLAYSPRNDVLEQIVLEAVQSLNANDPQARLNHISYPDAQTMEAALVESSFLAGVEFDDSWGSLLVAGGRLPDNLTFALRFPGELRRDENQFSNWVTNLLVVPFSPRLRNPEDNDGGSPSYYEEGFLAVQGAISRALIRRHVSGIELPTVQVQRYSYPPYYDDAILEALQQLLALIIIISFLYTFVNTVKYITIEKETQLKEAMKIMGLSNWLHWSAWFVKCLILLTIASSLITLLLCVPFSSAAIFENSSWTLIWLFFFVYSISTICFAFMISVFFSKANTAAGIAGLLWFVSQLPFNVSQQNYDEMGTGAKIGMSILSNSGMSLAMFLTVRLEATAAGLRWSNLFEPVTIDDGFNVGLVLIMLLVDAAIYMLIALYVEQVMPGQYGVAQPWYFPFTKEFWMRKRAPTRDTLIHAYGTDPSSFNSHYIEQDPVGYAGVEIKQLRKVYKGNKAAVDGLNLRMYENQISVLLGHNGAGKTTTMSMLTGVYSPTSGTALINGYDIRTDIDGVRSSLGLCPQHNVLFNEMTVEEHLKFFSRLKGVPHSGVADEIDRYLKLLELTDKRNAQSQTLSGGMKRKLAVGMALCGGSKVVLLDEPTSGMDPSARRALWNLLQREKQNRTMLLSTHFMDEADVLGDRIAIMAEGKLKAVGSPFFLKKSFGVGYRLICVKDSVRCDKERLLGILRRYIPDVTIDTDIGSELSFILKEDYIDVFQRLLEDIEQQMSSCGITSYGISLTTMEEVFLKAGSDSFDETANHTTNGSVIETTNREYALGNLVLLTGKELYKNQIWAQILKKFLSTIRAWKQLLMMFLIPIFFVCITFIITNQQRSISAGVDLPSLDIAMDSYEKAITVLERSSGETTRVEAYQRMFELRQAELINIDEDMTEYIVRKSKEDISTVNTQYFVGATITSGQPYIGWFNNKAFHTAPLALSLLFNAILQSSCPQCEITVVNKPLPYRLETQLKKLNTGLNTGFQLAFNTGFAMAFVAALYIMFYIKERTSRAKLLQFVSGTNVALFWGLAFLWDYALFVLNSLVYIATVAIFQEDGWSSFEELGRAFLLLLFFGFASLPVTYLFSFIFNVSATGFVRMMFVNVLSGAIFFTTVNILKFDGIDLNDVAEGLEWVFMFFPNFVLSHGLNNLNQASSTISFCTRTCEQLLGKCSEEQLCSFDDRCCDLSLFSFGKLGIIRNLLFCLLIGCASFALLFGLEYGLVQRLFHRKKAGATNSINADHPGASSDMDSDVLEEKRRIQNLSRGDIDGHNLLLRDVSKYYGNFQAVNKLSIGINHSECFGLLGINGAGKTTTFKMMTGDEEISSGDGWVRGNNLRTDMNRVHRQIGYCPQFDALLDDLTGRETLRIFALLRGVRSKEIKNVSYILAEELNFAKHLDKRTVAYSGGNKRKLSTALALLGNPSVVYLDEPTTGMDPGAKRQFWDVICKVRSTGKSIVLTSHSMEECEALCTRLAIMVNGEFKCLGSTQHLKNKFSKGFLLTVKVKRSTPEAQQKRVTGVKDFVTNRFAGAILKEEYEDSLSFHIPVTDLKWSQMFGLMESHKQELEIDDYALGQTSLEQVFLFFTKYQREVD